MSLVHLQCLNHWRSSSANPRSFYQCDTCHFQYRFGTALGADKLSLARLLATPYVVHAGAMLALCWLIFVMGFLAKMFDPTLTNADVIACFNIGHMLSGATATGLVSVVGWATSATGLAGGGWRFMIGDAWNDTRGSHGNDAFATILLACFVIAGLSLALWWIYERLEALARQTVRTAQHVVLDVGEDPDGPLPEQPTRTAAHGPVYQEVD